jgi:hypothetical protein
LASGPRNTVQRRSSGQATESRWRFSIKLAIFAAAGIWLSWRVLVLGVADVTERPDPGAALAWRPAQSTALAILAAKQFDDAKSAADLAGAEALARRSLALQPLQSPAVRVLGLAAALNNQAPRTDPLFSLAERISKRDGPAQLWLLDRALRAADYPAVVSHADALLRVNPDERPFLIPALIEASAGSRAVAPLADHLSARPDWRPQFLTRFGAESTDPKTPFLVFQGLKRGPAPATDDEIAPYFARLVAAGLYQDAYRRWSSLYAPNRASSVGQPYDGAFVGLPGPPPFNWILADGEAELGGQDDAPSHRGLHVTYDASSAHAPARQLVVLSPGDYELSGDVLFDTPPDPDQIGWVLKCVAGDEALADVRQNGAPEHWLHFSGRLSVPASNCAAQWLTLDARADGDIGDMSVWYANLKISPAGAPPTAARPVTIP